MEAADSSKAATRDEKDIVAGAAEMTLCEVLYAKGQVYATVRTAKDTV